MQSEIDYANLAERKSPLTGAAARAVMLSEKDFIGAAVKKPLDQVLPAAVQMPDSGIVDFSEKLGLSYPATMPCLLAGTTRLKVGEASPVAVDAGAAIVLILSGDGQIDLDEESVELIAGDILSVPGHPQGSPSSQVATITAGSTGIRYLQIDDSPLAQYAGWQVIPNERTALTHYPAELLAAKLAELTELGINASGVFLSHQELRDEKLCTPILFALLNRLEPGAANIVHAHSAGALTYVIDGNKNNISMLGHEINDDHEIIDPITVDWVNGQLSITPPNLWHGHQNNGDGPILSLVVQLAGFYYNERTMNFKFAKPISAG